MRYFLDTEFLEDGETIMPISLGIVAEDGRELYIEMQFDQAMVEAHPWLLENVLPHLRFRHEDRLDRAATAAAVLEFVGEDAALEFWAYYADYDWVVICQIFGTMMGLPKHFPKFCMDLQQWYVQLGRPEHVKPAAPEREHDALVDARWNARFYERLVAHAGPTGPTGPSAALVDEVARLRAVKLAAELVLDLSSDATAWDIGHAIAVLHSERDAARQEAEQAEATLAEMAALLSVTEKRAVKAEGRLTLADPGQYAADLGAARQAVEVWQRDAEAAYAREDEERARADAARQENELLKEALAEWGDWVAAQGDSGISVPVDATAVAMECARLREAPTGGEGDGEKRTPRAPRYDSVYFEGVAALREADGSDTSDKPCQFEIEILQEAVGERAPRPWGAAVGAALEYLRGHRYLRGNELTDKGRAILTEAPTAGEGDGGS